jgi:hypothetical protein
VLPLDDFGKHDKVGENRWRARLSSNQERELYILLERPPLSEELGSILPFRGLWGAFHLGVMDMFWSCGAKRFVFPRSDFTFLTLQGDYQLHWPHSHNVDLYPRARFGTGSTCWWDHGKPRPTSIPNQKWSYGSRGGNSDVQLHNLQAFCVLYLQQFAWRIHAYWGTASPIRW